MCFFDKRLLYKGLVVFLVVVLMSSCKDFSKSSLSGKEIRIERKVDSVLQKMTLIEKIGQTAQRGKSSRVKELPEHLKQAVRDGKVGSFLNIMNVEDAAELQRIAIEESPNGIPLIFARDVIHGFKTIFPIPLGQAATFNPHLVERGARISAVEASSKGIRWTFAPMLDISRDPRWGRIAESAGEDSYLTSEMGKAYIKGFQGDSLKETTSIAACAKHFAGYGAAEGGRDYNTANINENLLHNEYLKPFKSAVEANCATFMAGFNELNGVPVSGNSYLLKEVLRNDWGFDGFVVSDWNSVTEMINHGFAKDKKEAASKGINAMLDMEMTSTAYEEHLEELIEEGLFSEKKLNAIVRNILRIKFELGLFENPYFEKDDAVLYAKSHLDAAKEAAVESMVLLKNKEKRLPISKKQKIALIGPLVDAPHEQLGTWTFDGEKEHTITPLQAFKEDKGLEWSYAKGVAYSRDKSKEKFNEAIRAAKSADVIVFFGGEEAILSGEAHSRADLSLPGVQEELLLELSNLGKPIVLVVMAGRPITLERVLPKVDAVLMAWHPGTMGGVALKSLLYGEVSPSGKLPISWPKKAGQIPIYYNHKNTGRPVIPEKYVGIDDIPVGAWQSSLGNTSHYLDAGYLPQWPFGYGLSYSETMISEVQWTPIQPKEGDQISISFTVSNVGKYPIKETIQLYFRDVSASITRPVKELLRFEKIRLDANERKRVNFTFSTEDLKFYNSTKGWSFEPGDFVFWVAKHAQDDINKINLTIE